MNADIIKYVIKNIGTRLTRSSLTILSILIGVMAIFAIISFGQGVGKYVDDFTTTTGADKLIAMPSGAGVPGTGNIILTEADLNVIMKTNGVSEATAMIMQQAEIRQKEDKKGKWVYIAGLSTDPGEQKMIDEAFGGIGILEGRNIRDGDMNKVSVGYNYQVAGRIFDKPFRLGDKIFVNGYPFEIVGFWEEVGNPQDDANIYMTLEAAEEFFDIEGKYGAIYIRANKGVDVEDLADRLTEKLRKEKGQEEGQEDFYVQSYAQLMETFGTVLNILNGILAIIAGISVLVAGVNITNTMYTAVLERTREIGVMKAIGARNSYILMIFFVESGILGLIGGTLGIILGYGIAKTGGAIAAGAGYSMLKPYFPWWLIVGSLVFSFVMGAGSGFFPARAASRQKPVDALRYE